MGEVFFYVLGLWFELKFICVLEDYLVTGLRYSLYSLRLKYS